ncbi:MAG: peptide ABC transporter substrate-binding protein [Eubacteriaceae bacterium]|nr:peptide ABC transporter substrate-binding protein [Eubacteriaceae bacterium]
MKKKVLSLLLVVFMVVALLAACSSAQVPKTEMLSVNVGPEPESIDPAFNEAVDGATLLVHAFEGLMTLDKDGMPVPGQAESYKVSDDGLTYTFTLRDDIKWSDGEDVVAEDFIYAWKRAIDPVNATSYGYMFDVIKGAGDIYNGTEGAKMEDFGVKAIDDKTIEITLIAPTPYFLELCAFPNYFPVRQDIVEENEAWATDPATYVSNGPYKLESWTHDSEMVYVKNENYYNVKKLGPEKIRFILMADDNAILAAFQNGEILFADSMPQAEIDAYRDKPEFNLEGQLGTYYISFNTEKAPFDNEKVRKALSLAIDRNFIVTQIGKAGQQPASAFVSTGLSDADAEKEFRTVGGDYYSIDAADYEANVAEAKQLLTEAGYPDGKGFPKFEYMYNEGGSHGEIAQALQDMWKEKLGIECTLASQEWSVFLTTRQEGNYQVARDGWLADYNDPITFLDMYRSTSGNNNSQWKNPAYDKLIDKIKASSDKEERFKLMHEAEDILMAEAPVAPIYFYVDIFLKSPKLEGFYSSPLGYKYFMYSSVTE